MKDDTVVKFPGANVRNDEDELFSAASIEQAVRDMKKDYFSGVAEYMVDDILREISMLRMDESKMWKGPPTNMDSICLKEAVLATMYRTVGMEHPLHKIMDQNIVLDDRYVDDSEDVQQVYHFKEA